MQGHPRPCSRRGQGPKQRSQVRPARAFTSAAACRAGWGRAAHPRPARQGLLRGPAAEIIAGEPQQSWRCRRRPCRHQVGSPAAPLDSGGMCDLHMHSAGCKAPNGPRRRSAGSPRLMGPRPARTGAGALCRRSVSGVGGPAGPRYRPGTLPLASCWGLGAGCCTKGELGRAEGPGGSRSRSLSCWAMGPWTGCGKLSKAIWVGKKGREMRECVPSVYFKQAHSRAHGESSFLFQLTHRSHRCQ